MVIGSLLAPTKQILLVPERSKKYAEFFCKFDYGFLAACSYNAVLMLVCCYYAFRTRQVPDNYNESKFIGISVYSNVVVCLSVIPVYIVATSALYKKSIMCLALLVNSFLHVMCVYAPKIYAVRFAPDDPTVRTMSSIRKHVAMTDNDRKQSNTRIDTMDTVEIKVDTM